MILCSKLVMVPTELSPLLLKQASASRYDRYGASESNAGYNQQVPAW